MKLSGILFDLDGVLYDAERKIPGAAEAVQWVHAEGIPHLFVTNTSSRSRADIAAKLARFGMPATEEHILTPAIAAVEWLRSNSEGPVAAFVRPAALRDFAGLTCLPEEAETGASYVIIGDLGSHWDYAKMNRAFRLLHSNPDAKLVALGMTRYWLASDGVSLDVGPFVVALEHASGRKAMVFGKPAFAFFNAAAQRLGLPGGELLMIGDDIDADVAGAQAAGLKGAMVRTGKFRAADLERGVRPDAVLDSVADLPGWWQKMRSCSF